MYHIESEAAVWYITRTGKRAYKEVQYNEEHQPPDFISPQGKEKHVRFNLEQGEKANDQKKELRRSERIRTKAKTQWKPAKVAHVMIGTIVNALLVTNHVYAEPAKPLQNFELSSVFKPTKTTPISKYDKKEKLRHIMQNWT